jgi:pyruvate dehydrogenase E2 component (dihydrolipoamide acetyltransferase)
VAAAARVVPPPEPLAVLSTPGAGPAPASPVGTGLGGRLTRAEQQALSAEPAAGPVSPGTPEFPGTYTDTPLTGIRKLVATRMLASMAAHAQLTFHASAPAANLLALRARLKASDPAWGLDIVTIGDLVAYAAVRTATRFPAINATVEAGVLRTFDAVHLGLAVDTDRGLLVPTVQFASDLDLREFAACTKARAAAARVGTISPDLLAGATFTVTNLGAFGIESFTPILNSPQTAILGVNAILPRPVIAADGTVGAEQRISFSLTVDHAVVDGADAARFLQALTAYVADIDLAILAEGGLHV